MDFIRLIIRFIPAFSIALVVCMGVTFLWNLAYHGVAKIDWATTFRFAILFGIIIPIIGSRKGMKSE